MQARGPLDNLRATESLKDEDAIEAALKNPPPGGWLPQGVGGRRAGGKEGGREEEKAGERGGGGGAKTEAEPAFQQEDSTELGGDGAGKEEGVEEGEKKSGDAGAGEEGEHVAHCLRTKGFQVKILPRYSRNSCNTAATAPLASLMPYSCFTLALFMLY